MARWAASGRQINVRRNRDDPWTFEPKFQDRVEQRQLNDAGRQRMLKQEMAQRAIVVRMRHRRGLMSGNFRLGRWFRVMMVVMPAARVVLNRLRVSRATRVFVSCMFVRVDDCSRGRHQQRTRRQPRHQTSSTSVEHDSHPSKWTPSDCLSQRPYDSKCHSVGCSEPNQGISGLLRNLHDHASVVESRASKKYSLTAGDMTELHEIG